MGWLSRFFANSADESLPRPFKVRYEGMYEDWTKSFASLEDAAKYLVRRSLVIVNAGHPEPVAFGTDYGTFYLEGFSLTDIGRFLPRKVCTGGTIESPIYGSVPCLEFFQDFGGTCDR